MKNFVSAWVANVVVTSNKAAIHVAFCDLNVTLTDITVKGITIFRNGYCDQFHQVSVPASGSVLFYPVELCKVVSKLLFVIAYKLSLEAKDISFFIE